MGRSATFKNVPERLQHIGHGADWLAPTWPTQALCPSDRPSVCVDTNDSMGLEAGAIASIRERGHKRARLRERNKFEDFIRP